MCNLFTYEYILVYIGKDTIECMFKEVTFFWISTCSIPVLRVYTIYSIVSPVHRVLKISQISWFHKIMWLYGNSQLFIHFLFITTQNYINFLLFLDCWALWHSTFFKLAKNAFYFIFLLFCCCCCLLRKFLL